MRYIDSYISLKREDAAEVCGITDAQLKQWHDRGNLFPENRVGKGFRIQYGLRDLFTIRTVAVLIEGGMGVTDACNMLRDEGVFGSFLHDPGCGFTIARTNDGKWRVGGGTGFVMQIEIDLVEVAKFIWQRLKPLAASVYAGQDGIEAAITHFDDAIHERESERYEIMRARYVDAATRANKGKARFE